MAVTALFYIYIFFVLREDRVITTKKEKDEEKVQQKAVPP